MFQGLEAGISLDIVQWFQTLRFGLLDNIAIMLHYMNNALFYVVVIGAIYWMFDKKLGMRMLFALTITGMITLVFKDLFMGRRPFEIPGGGIIPLIIEPSSGIPSAHATMTLVVWGYFAIYMKQRRIAIAFIIFEILMGLSRIYAGVHFPQDVIAGWILGAAILWVYVKMIEPAEIWWHKQVIWIQLGLPVVIGLVSMMYFLGKTDGLTLVGLLIGVGVAAVLENRYVHFARKNEMGRRIAQFVFGLVVAIGILFGLDFMFDKIEPPTYVYAENDIGQVTELQSQVNMAGQPATEVCTAADHLGIEDAIRSICEIEVTRFAAILRVLRYGLLGLFAMSLIPYMCIRLNLMERE